MQNTASSKKIKWNFEQHKWEGITKSQAMLWEQLYPDVDITKVLQLDIPQWLDKKSDTKIIRKKNWKRTICNWLKKEQEKAVGY